jgi:formylglycine-generating enzyme required for sulfatase activity
MINRIVSRKVPAVVLALLLLASLSAWAQTPSTEPVSVALIAIHAAGSSVSMGDGTFGPKISQALSYDFQMAKYPVTNGLFAQFLADNGYTSRELWTSNGWAWKRTKASPLFWKSSAFNGADQPVVGVSWYEAVAFCNWLSTKEGLAPAYDGSGRARLDATGYRLPTEVEWEYASAKGAPDQAERIFPWGDEPNVQYAVSNVPPSHAPRTENVGSRSPQGDTPQGLADMSGNVWEWCSDNFQGDPEIAVETDHYYFVSDARDQRFVLHGGSWVISFMGGLHAKFRSFSSDPGSLYNAVGFRVVRPDSPASGD